MRKIWILAVVCLLFVGTEMVRAEEGLKVFISVDMEGITGVILSEECSLSGMDYGMFRKVMTLETNYAVEGALAAGATEVWVRDSHGSARNIIPELLHEKAVLLRGWSGGFKSMMEGIDESFDAVIFIGYHARAGTPDAIIEHTMSGSVMNSAVNGVDLPEAGWNALIAGHYNVPVVFASGDKALCDQLKEMFGQIETVSVKTAIGASAVNLHPKVAGMKIRKGVEKAIRERANYKPFKLTSPYTLVLTLKYEEMVYNGSFYPGAERTGEWELTYKSDSILDIAKAFIWMRK